MNSREDDIFDGIGIEIALPHPGQERADFLKVRETLTRVGTVSDPDGHLALQVLDQSCYILHKRGRYVIAHLRELQWLDGAPVEASVEEVAIRNRVSVLLENWELVDILDEDDSLRPIAPVGALRIIPHRDKDKWQLTSSYDIGGFDRKRAIDRVGNRW
jgi:hypothetical protein